MESTLESDNPTEHVDTQASTYVEDCFNSQQFILESKRGRRPRHQNSDFEELKKIVQLRLDNLTSNLLMDENELVESFKSRNKERWRNDLKSVSKTWASKSDDRTDKAALRIFQTLQRNRDWQDSVLNMLARRIKNKCLINSFLCNEAVSDNPPSEGLDKDASEINSSKCLSEVFLTDTKPASPFALSEIVLKNNEFRENVVNEIELDDNALLENGQDDNIGNDALGENVMDEVELNEPGDVTKGNNTVVEMVPDKNVEREVASGVTKNSDATVVTEENTAHTSNQGTSPTSTLIDERICYCQQKYPESIKVVPCQICAQLFHYGEKMPHCDYDGFSTNWTCELCKPRKEPDRLCSELPKKNDVRDMEANSALNEPLNTHTHSELRESDANNSAKTRSSNSSLVIRDDDSEACIVNTSGGKTGTPPSHQPRANVADKEPPSYKNMKSDDERAEDKDCFDGRAEEDGDAMRQKVEDMAMLFGLDKIILDYKIPKNFTAKLHADLLGPVFDFDTMKFKNHVWPSAIAECLEDYVPCAFHGKSTPLYYKRRSKGFCKLRGKCGGDCKMEFDIFIRDPPTKGLDINLGVVASGNFQLYQRNPTSRPIKSDPVRHAMAKQLRNVKTNLVYLGKSTESIPKGLLLLHNNRHEHNLGTLKKLKSEDKLKSRTSMNLGEDLDNLAKSFEDSHFHDSHTPGFIQRIECKDHLTIYLYDKLSIDNHFLQMQKRNKEKECYLTIYIDATGSLVKKYKDKQVLSFYIIGEHIPGISLQK